MTTYTEEEMKIWELEEACDQYKEDCTALLIESRKLKALLTESEKEKEYFEEKYCRYEKLLSVEQKEKSIILHEYDSLTKKHDVLTKKHDELKEEYDDLEEEYYELKEEHDSTLRLFKHFQETK
jgi:chromosome segregation ATPase